MALVNYRALTLYRAVQQWRAARERWMETKDSEDFYQITYWERQMEQVAQDIERELDYESKRVLP